MTRRYKTNRRVGGLEEFEFYDLDAARDPEPATDSAVDSTAATATLLKVTAAGAAASKSCAEVESPKAIGSSDVSKKMHVVIGVNGWVPNDPTDEVSARRPILE